MGGTRRTRANSGHTNEAVTSSFPKSPHNSPRVFFVTTGSATAKDERPAGLPFWRELRFEKETPSILLAVRQVILIVAPVGQLSPGLAAQSQLAWCTLIFDPLGVHVKRSWIPLGILLRPV